MNQGGMIEKTFFFLILVNASFYILLTATTFRILSSISCETLKSQTENKKQKDSINFKNFVRVSAWNEIVTSLVKLKEDIILDILSIAIRKLFKVLFTKCKYR